MPERGDAIPDAAIDRVRRAMPWVDRQTVRDVLRAAQPEADRAPGGRWLCLVDHSGEHFASCIYEPPEADRAPGEAETVARALATHDAPHSDWTAMTERTRGLYRGLARAALDALRSEQGQSRDDTVTLAEAVHRFLLAIDAYPPEVESADSNAWRVGGAAREAWSVGFVELRTALARFGAGRAEGEDRG